MQVNWPPRYVAPGVEDNGISGLVVEYIVAIDVTRVRFPADAPFCYHVQCGMLRTSFLDRRGNANSQHICKQKRQRGDSNPCGQSPMDFESISLTARTHCHMAAFFTE